MAIERPTAPGARAARRNGEARYVGWQCRLYPNRSQARLLARCREGLRELSNTLLGASNLQYSQTGRHMTGKQFRAAAQDWCGRRANRDPFPSTAIYQTAADMHAAFRNWHRKPRPAQGLPRFKPEGRAPGIYVASAATRFDGDRVRLPKFGWMRWRGGSLPARRLEGPASRATLGMVYGRVWRDAGERWMLSCVFECGPSRHGRAHGRRRRGAPGRPARRRGARRPAHRNAGAGRARRRRRAAAETAPAPARPLRRRLEAAGRACSSASATSPATSGTASATATTSSPP